MVQTVYDEVLCIQTIKMAAGLLATEGVWIAFNKKINRNLRQSWRTNYSGHKSRLHVQELSSKMKTRQMINQNCQQLFSLQDNRR